MPSRLLYGRAQLRLGNLDDAVAVLRGLASGDHACVAERDALLAAAFTRAERFGEAEEALTSARAHAFGLASGALEAEVEYFSGLLSFVRGDLADFEAANYRVLNLLAPPAGAPADAYVVPLAHTRARAYEGLGAVALARSQYYEQATYARRALREVDDAPIDDVWIRANNVTNLAILAGNLDLFEHVEYLRERLTSLAWTDELASRRFTALDAFGWHLAIRGDNIGAFRHFRIAAEIAPSLAERVRASVSRAHLSCELGHMPVAVEELEHALDLAGRFDWDETIEGQRTALLHLAEAAAPVAPDAARSALDRYRKIRTKIGPLSLAKVEPWLAAGEDFTEGLLARQAGQRLKAIDAFRKAHDAWTVAGIEWRAARAAVELAELEAGEKYVAECKREAVKRPASWLARRVARLEG